MYPDMNINGVGGSKGSGRLESSRQREEQDPRDINVFGNSRVEDDEDNKTMRFINNQKRIAEEASQKTQSWVDRLKYYINQGYSQSEASKLADEDIDGDGGEITRESLVNRLVIQGYDYETAESLVPKNIETRIAEARAEGSKQAIKDNDAIYRKVFGPNFKTYFK